MTYFNICKILRVITCHSLYVCVLLLLYYTFCALLFHSVVLLAACLYSTNKSQITLSWVSECVSFFFSRRFFLWKDMRTRISSPEIILCVYKYVQICCMLPWLYNLTKRDEDKKEYKLKCNFEQKQKKKSNVTIYINKGIPVTFFALWRNERK